MGKRLMTVLLALGVALAAGSSVLAQEPPVEDEVVTAPVDIDGVTLFRLRGVSSFPAAVRARLVRERIVAAAANHAVTTDSIRVLDGGGVHQIAVGDQPLLTIVDADASLEQVGRAELANAHLFRIRQAITDYRAARSPTALRRAALQTLAATVAFALGVVVLLWSWRRLNERLATRYQSRIQTVGIQSFEVMRADRIRAMLWNLIAGVKTVILLAGALVYIAFVLAAWPGTRGLSSDMVAFVLAPLTVLGQGLVANIPSLVFLAVLFFVIRVVLRITRLFFESVERRTVTLSGFDADWASSTYKLVRLAIVAFGLIVAYPYIPGSEPSRAYHCSSASCSRWVPRRRSPTSSPAT
jgi:hypothetical protein